MTNPTEDAELVLNLSRYLNKKVIVHVDQQLATTKITNYNQITLGNMSSARLKILSRTIASESERSLRTHILMNIACQFCEVKCAKQPSNLSSGDIPAEKLAKRMLDYDEVFPIDSR